MLEKAERSFQRLARLGEPEINTGLLAALEGAAPGPGFQVMRANLLRRAGDLQGARSAFRAHLRKLTDRGGEAMHQWVAIPPGLKTSGGYAIAPLVVIDDFLPLERMRALHAHACERQSEFHVAKATNQGAPPAYDPERRQTLLDWEFEQEREFFVTFIEENLSELQNCLGLPSFAIDRIEIKLTNHVNGGFFKTHCDNRAGYCEAGRAITWLYYFGEEVPRFRGGALYLQDSKPTEELLSPAWFTTVTPRPNRLVAFPSWFYHAVGPMHLPVSDFRAGRFAVSSHVRKCRDQGRAWWEDLICF